MTPVMCGTSYRNKGVQPLLDNIIYYMPSPVDIPAYQGYRFPPIPMKEMERVTPPMRSPSAALAFKIMVDPFVGKLAFFRVYSGHPVRAAAYVMQLHQAKARAYRAASCL